MNWKDSKFIDLWSIVHLLSGFLLGGFFYWHSVKFWWALVFTFAAILLWEMFEYLIKILESPLNVLSDIAIGLIGFMCASYLYNYKNLFDLKYFFIICIITLALSIIGFLNSIKRKSF